MDEISFDASFDELKKVRITQPHGAQGNYQILIDNFYCGIIINSKNGLQVYLNEKLMLTAVDNDILVRIVLENR